MSGASGSADGQVYGPVPSRRLGRSLGVDLVPFKTCTYDCVYCQLGRTTCTTLERREWVPIESALSELAEKLSTRPDYITLSGSGEPTLNSRIGEVVQRVKAMSSIPLAVLTNGSLLADAGLRRELLQADLVIPSLDAGDESAFRQVNRPHEDITFEKLVDGLAAFRQQFDGQYWLEVFLVAGLNATEAHVAKIAQCVSRIRLDRVQLNTATRPPAEEFVKPVPREQMVGFAAMFDPPGEVIAGYRWKYEGSDFVGGKDAVLQLLRRRPCRLQDIADGLGMHPNEALKYVQRLQAEGRVTSSRIGNGLFFYPTR